MKKISLTETDYVRAQKWFSANGFKTLRKEGDLYLAINGHDIMVSDGEIEYRASLYYEQHIYPTYTIKNTTNSLI